MDEKSYKVELERIAMQGKASMIHDMSNILMVLIGAIAIITIALLHFGI